MARICTLVLLVLLSGCGRHEPLPGSPRPLPRDSLSTLREAVQRARPAFSTQEEALRSGVYGKPSSGPDRPPILPSGSGSFVIQVAAFREREPAERFLQHVRERLPAYRATISHEARVYRVVLPGWETRDAAGAERVKLAAVFPDLWVRPAASP